MPLPEDIITKVRADFSEDDSLLVLSELTGLQKENPEIFSERILRCVVQVARGRVQDVDRAVALARTDWRDLIVAAEYEWSDRVRLLALPFGTHPEVALFRRWFAGQQIEVPWGVGCDKQWTIEHEEIRELSLEKVEVLENRVKKIADPDLFGAHLRFLCIRGPKEISVSKAIDGKIFLFYRRYPEIKGFKFLKFLCRPQDLGKRGQW